MEQKCWGVRDTNLWTRKWWYPKGSLTIAPQDMRQHLMLNQSRLSTAEEVAQEIEDYCDEIEEFSRDDTNQPGFFAPVGKGLAKGGKPNGVPYNFGKSSGTKGKGKMHKGLGFQPERGEQRKFGGYCNWCWRFGQPSVGLNKSTWRANHLRTRCKETFGNGQTRQRKGKVTARDQAGSPNEDGQCTLGVFWY